MNNTTQSTGHPAGLWVLFTTELWERFAFYAMRAILVLYLIAEADKHGNPGFGWSEADAYMLYGWYTSLVYVAPLLGGWMADSFLGQRRAVILGAVIMAIGEFFLFATEAVRIGEGTPITMATDPTALITFYAGLGLMVLGNGFFKPCISVMVGQLYAPGDRRRDSAFSIFYMGINIGAAISPLVAGLLADKFGFQWGFFAAGVGMCIGLTIQLAFSPLFLKGIGTLSKHHDGETLTPEEKEKHDKKVYEQTRPLVKQDWDRMFVIVVLSLFVIAFWLTFEQAGSSLNVFAEKNTDRLVPSVISAPITFQTKAKSGSFMEYVLPFLFFEDKMEEAQQLKQNTADTEIVLRVLQMLYRANFTETDTDLAGKVQRIIDRTKKQIEEFKIDAEKAEVESQPHPINLFFSESKQYLKERAKNTGERANIAEEEAVNAETTAKNTMMLLNIVKQFSAENQTPASEKAVQRFQTLESELQSKAERARKWAMNMKEQADKAKKRIDNAAEQTEEKANTAEEAKNAVIDAEKITMLLAIVERLAAENPGEESEKIVEQFKKLAAELQSAADKAPKGTEEAKEQTEDTKEQTESTRQVSYVFPAAWYQSVNAIGIVIFAPIFTMIWNFLYRRGIEPSTPVKFALGILLVSASFFVMIPGAIQAAQTGGNAAVYWLLACYLFATWGELCLSPVGLSMITKLSPARYASIFMGVWFLASAAAYWLAGYCASVFAAGEGITILFGKECGLADFFLLLAIIPAVIGFIALAMAPMLKKKMHGIL
jgi:dipeptide/tripeptide permease